MSGFSTSSGAASLWAHLNRKDANGRTNPPTSTATPDFLPPTGPQDRTATTMRVLLHDTQMNFEKFSEQVEGLIKDVQKTEQGIKTTNTLFEKEHDKLMGDIIDLVNRVQTQLQASIGTPAQTSATDALFKNVDRRLESLDQRLDAIQAQELRQAHPAHSLRPGVTPSSSKQSKPNFRLDNIIRQASVQRSGAGPSNQNGRGFPVVNSSIGRSVSQRVPFTLQGAAVPPPHPPQIPENQSIFNANPLPPPMLPPPATVTSNAGQQRRGTMMPLSSLQAKMTAPHMFPGKEPVQFKEGKRFIPLIDTDDEDDEVEDEIVG
ncbi:hypothetical protein EST38_g5127 [Candolleomyces aberdarensis]|uniref:Uncharacterized protein n=1 Tax=Candolleomyces aberdarensis TaxID=2316362 RepID=A0A4Q2DMZ0_9AGAR|nr:hypothetical protein EST38_g5127 [Candolleomyces aberdarensis]